MRERLAPLVGGGFTQCVGISQMSLYPLRSDAEVSLYADQQNLFWEQCNHFHKNAAY